MISYLLPVLLAGIIAFSVGIAFAVRERRMHKG